MNPLRRSILLLSLLRIVFEYEQLSDLFLRRCQCVGILILSLLFYSVLIEKVSHVM